MIAGREPDARVRRLHLVPADHARRLGDADRVRLRGPADAVAADDRAAAGQLLRLADEVPHAQAGLHGGAAGPGLSTRRRRRRMYEIWLVMNIVWEIALDVWPLLLAAAAGLGAAGPGGVSAAAPPAARALAGAGRRRGRGGRWPSSCCRR
ncbi:MAG: hypothetical protein MZW92_30155 [Comamonadaceae bacterium]|nr:hypothetical protein [Comamonadaceae bacterium]